MEKGALVCEACGSEQPSLEKYGPRPAQPRPDPVAEAVKVMEGPQCPEHPGMPLLGNCPRCQKQVCVRCAPDAVRDILTCDECYGLNQAHKLAPAQSICAVHPDKRAVFVCARCGNFACAGCKPAHDDSGKCAKCSGVAGPMATRGDRFVANFVDNCIVLVLPLLSVFVMAVGMPRQGIADPPRDSSTWVGVWVLVMFGTFAGGLVAQLLSQVRWGQSIGKRLTGIKVVRRDGSPMELWRLIVMRNLLLGVINTFCNLAGLVDVLMIFTQDQRCLHDYLADSIVIDTGPTQQP